MKFIEITEKEITEFYLSDPKLIYQALSDEEMVGLYETKKYTCLPNSNYIGIEHDGEFLALIHWEVFTQTAVVVHVRLKTKYQGTGIIKDIFLLAADYFTKLNKTTVISFAPESCIHASKALLKLGFKEQCLLPNTITWRQKLQGLYMYSLELPRGEKCQQ